VEIGLALPHYDFSIPGENPLRWETLLGTARRAAELGVDEVYLSDHLFLDVEKYGGGPGHYGTFEPLVTLAALACEVERVRLGTLVLCEALRPAGVLAKTLATLDTIAGGRIDVGIGGGWYEPEYEAIGMTLPPPGERLARTSEAVRILTGLLGGGPYTLHGKFHTVRDAIAQPASPQQPRPRVFVGGKGDRLLRLVAEEADGWNTVWVWTPDAYAERVGVLERACEDAGRDPDSVWRTLGLYTLVGEDEADLEARYRRMQEQAPGGMLDTTSLDQWRQGRLVGTVDEVAAQAAAWREAGVAQLILCVGPLPFSLTSPDDLEVAVEAVRAGAVT